MKIGKGESEEGGRKGIKKETSCILYMYPLPKMTVKCMYCEHVPTQNFKR